MTGGPVLVADLHHTTEASRWPIFAGAGVEQSDIGALRAPFTPSKRGVSASETRFAKPRQRGLGCS
ncbi:MAG: hypothetical protein ACRDSZ_14810 [Pseudonocardiaceae bacterium]